MSGATGTAAGRSGQGGLRIFLNYRREDAADAAGRLFDALAAHFGSAHVFMDIDTIEPGVDFEEVVNRAVGECDVLLAVIGQRWLTVTDARGRRRLDRPDDYVRLELKAALDRDVRVIPVLVQGVDMPGSDELPQGLKTLARRNAMDASPGRWRYDIGRLTTALERIGETTPRSDRAGTGEPPPTKPPSPPQPPPSPPARSRNLLPLILLGIIALAGIAVGALAASGAFSHSGSTHTIISPAANKTHTGNKSHPTNGGNGTNNPPPSETLTQHCSVGIDTTQSISCGLASNVFYEYYMNAQNGGNQTSLAAWSTVTKQYYNVNCSVVARSVKCAVIGTTDPHAEVELTQAALDAYTPQQASTYAAHSDLGPRG